MSTHKLHAEHNEKVCREIINLAGYDDWIITTAFYTCIHYVEHKIFPLTEAGTTYDTFNRYYNNIILSKAKRISKHQLKVNLVYSYLPSVGDCYKRLFDNCYTARYNNYKIGATLSKIAIEDMEKVKLACI